ncbi:threonylcarbamoyl-AMP synthase [Clostridiales bacterium F-3ap]|uniref:Threonylcarbamoyl-AMP synthase n=2 Tax=Anaerotalea alkaliphila TaxID=2662126 RepID=A0A7X5HU49_9FIRM|nr:threonylcarbamoyl-AMP synthase [Anaerotalea alkaliphila]
MEDLLEIHGNDFDEAAAVLRGGGLVAFPTETVYGIGANALDGEAIGKVYAAKGRPSDNPLIVHIGRKEQLTLYATGISEKAMRLVDRFWPGPLTLVFKKRESIPAATSGGLDTVAVRMPSHPIALELIQKAGVPVAAPSANVSGRPSPTLGEHVIEDLSGRVDVIIDGGSARIGLESTVVDMTGEIPVVLRPGGVTVSMLEHVVGPVEVDPTVFENGEHLLPRAPGMKYKHYAPKGQMEIVLGDPDRVAAYIKEQLERRRMEGKRAGVIASAETANLYGDAVVLAVGSGARPEEVAANLFKVLRDMDGLQIEHIYSEGFSSEDLGLATMNRLMKAAGNRVVHV